MRDENSALFLEQFQISCSSSQPVGFLTFKFTEVHRRAHDVQLTIVWSGFLYHSLSFLYPFNKSLCDSWAWGTELADRQTDCSKPAKARLAL